MILNYYYYYEVRCTLLRMSDKGFKGIVGYFVKSFLRRPSLHLHKRTERNLYPASRGSHFNTAEMPQSSLHGWEESPVTFLMMPQKSEAS